MNDYDEDGYRIEDESGAQNGGNFVPVEPVTLDFIPSSQKVHSSSAEQLIYLLLIINTEGSTRQNNQLPMNIALVLDQSSSMRGEKLFSVKSAAKQLVDQLTVNDFFSLVTFNDRATTVVGCQKVTSRETIKSQIDSVDAKGGTELAQGLQRGISEMRPATQMTDLNYLLLLTDGQTYGDADQCVYLGMEAARHKIVIHPMGIGTDWNEDLLETVAAKCGSSSEFIETPDQIVKIFIQKINQLRSTLTSNANIVFKPVPGVKLRQAYRIIPNISDLEQTNAPGGSDYNIALGPMGRSSEYRVLLEVIIPPFAPGTYQIANLGLNYVTSDEQQPFTVRLPIGLTFVDSQQPTPVSHEVRAIIEKITTFKIQAKAWQDISDGNIDSGKKKLAAVGTRLLSMGEVDLAAQVQEEIQNLEQRGSTSAEGKKRIKYGTRGLTGAID